MPRSGRLNTPRGQRGGSPRVLLADVDHVLIVDVWPRAKNHSVSIKKVVTFASGRAVSVVLGDMNPANDIFGQSGVGVQAGEVFVRKLGASLFVV